MKHIKCVSFILVLTMIGTSMTTFAGAGPLSVLTSNSEIEDQGIIDIIEVRTPFIVENGDREIYVIKTEKEVQEFRNIKGYVPINLEKDFPDYAKEGLKVKFTGHKYLPRLIDLKNVILILRGYIPIELTSIDTIEPDVNIPPEADFEFIPEKPVVDQEVNFIDKSEDPDGRIVEYNWDFGDKADEQTYDVQSPSYIYDNPGVYNVRLIVTDDDGAEDSIIKKVVVRENSSDEDVFELVLEADPIELTYKVFNITEFEPQPNYVRATFDEKIHALYDNGTVVRISALDICEDYHFECYSGDVNQDETDFEITMDSDKNVVAHYIKEHPEPEPPVVDFSYHPIDPTVGDIVRYHDDSYDEDGEIVEWLWYFGDRSEPSREENPEHKYDSPGEYQVSLIVTDDDGLSSEKTKTVVIKAEPEPIETSIAGTVNEKFSVMNNPIPIPGADVYLLKREAHVFGPRIIDSTKTDDNGNYKFKVEEGSYTIGVKKAGYIPNFKNIDIKEGEEKIVNLYLTKIL